LGKGGDARARGSLFPWLCPCPLTIVVVFPSLVASPSRLDAAREAKPVQRLVLLTDSAGGVYLCTVVVALQTRMYNDKNVRSVEHHVKGAKGLPHLLQSCLFCVLILLGLVSLAI
jgi:hypothetical protein